MPDDFARNDEIGAPTLPLLCAVNGCERPKLAFGLCQLHYRRVKTSGSPGGPEPMRGADLRKTPEQRLWGKVNRGASDECWEWQGARGQYGHGRTMHYADDGHRIWTAAHRLAWELTNGPIPDGMFVCHHCDNPPCCNPVHLFLGTAADNTWDMVTKGRHGSVRLSAEQVAEIRRLYVRQFAVQLSRSGVPNRGGRMRSNTRELAAKFGIGESYVKTLIRGLYRKEVS